MVIRNRLREIREERMHLTLAEVAKLLECDVSTVSRHESGDRSLTPDWIDRYARLYKIQSYEIFMEPGVLGDAEEESVAV